MARSGKLMQIATTGPGAARRFVRSSLSVWGDAAIVEDAVLLVSELVTSALHHGATAATVDAVVSSESVRIEVRDGHADESDRRRRTIVVPDGFSYAVVAALASDWGIEEGDGGTTVWFELHTDRSVGRYRNVGPAPIDG
jgi:hypothetical protein